MTSLLLFASLASIPNPDIYYFAYGSNLSRDFMLERLKDGEWVDDWHRSGLLHGPEPVDLGCYRLANFAFGYTLYATPFGEDGTAGNVTRQEGAMTYGVVYALSAAHLQELDQTESFPIAYQRLLLDVAPCAGADALPLKAWVYVGQPQYVTDDVQPDPTYIELLRAGAAQHGLPADYVQEHIEHATASP